MNEHSPLPASDKGAISEPDPHTRVLPPAPATLPGEEMALRLEKIVPGVPKKRLVPFYHFAIVVDGQVAGHLNFRVGDTPHIRLFAGHIGFAVNETARGKRLAVRACHAVVPLVRRFTGEVIITANPDNIPSIRTLRRLGATFLDEMPVPEADRVYASGVPSKMRFLWRLPAGDRERSVPGPKQGF